MKTTDLKKGKKEVEIVANGDRDYAFLCSKRFQVYDGEVPVQPGVAAGRCHPRRRLSGTRVLRQAHDPASSPMRSSPYSRWFGPYPYPDFTICEAFFGWNGNECATLVMIDERIFNMPHMGVDYVDYLVSHEVCHQWWYTLLGTNGYYGDLHGRGDGSVLRPANSWTRSTATTTMLIAYPRGLEWAPNIRRQDYRSYGLYGTLGRGENSPTVADMPDFKHLVNLFSMCYDKGSRIVGMIEDRLGEENFFDFARIIYSRYRYRILRVKNLKEELEGYTDESWEEFFQYWLYGKRPVGLGDRQGTRAAAAVGGVRGGWRLAKPCPNAEGLCKLGDAHGLTRVVVYLKQNEQYAEQTGPRLLCRAATVTRSASQSFRKRRRITSTTRRPTSRPSAIANIAWKCCCPPSRRRSPSIRTRCWWTRTRPTTTGKRRSAFAPRRCTRSSTETDITNSYDRWNVIFGPWIYGTVYDDPWYPRGTLLGFRAGAYRTQEITGGVYTAYRTDYRDVVVGADGLWKPWPDAHFQTGFNIEQRLAAAVPQAQDDAKRDPYSFGNATYSITATVCICRRCTSSRRSRRTRTNFLPFARTCDCDNDRFDTPAPSACTTGSITGRRTGTPRAAFWWTRFTKAAWPTWTATAASKHVGPGRLYVQSLPDLSEHFWPSRGCTRSVAALPNVVG